MDTKRSPCNTNKKSTTTANEQNAKHTSTRGIQRSCVDTGTVQPTDVRTTDVVNSRHVCGGKESICEMLRSHPVPQWILISRKFERPANREPSADRPVLKSTKDNETSGIVNSKHVCGGKGSICEFLRTQPVAQLPQEDAKPLSPSGTICSGRARSPDARRKTASDILNSKHVCGGKDSICEFLRSKSIPETDNAPGPSCKSSAKTTAPDPCGNVTKPMALGSCGYGSSIKTTAPNPCGNVTKPVALESCGYGSSTKTTAPVPCGNVTKPVALESCGYGSSIKTTVPVPRGNVTKPVALESCGYGSSTKTVVPGPCGNVTKPVAVETRCGNIANTVSPKSCGSHSRTTAVKQPSHQENVETLEYVFNLYNRKPEDPRFRTDSVLNSGGHKQEENGHCVEQGFKLKSRKKEEHLQSTKSRFNCSCKCTNQGSKHEKSDCK